MAACALSFKPLFRMLAKALYLDSLLTHTRSLTRKTTTAGKSSVTKTGTTHSTLHIDTKKSTSHGGFTKLDSAKFGRNGNGSFDIVVTRTLEMDVEDRSDDGGYELQERGRKDVERDFGRTV